MGDGAAAAAHAGQASPLPAPPSVDPPKSVPDPPLPPTSPSRAAMPRRRPGSAAAMLVARARPGLGGQGGAAGSGRHGPPEDGANPGREGAGKGRVARLPQGGAARPPSTTRPGQGCSPRQRGQSPSSTPKGQWELKLQTDIGLARRALRDALSVDAAAGAGPPWMAAAGSAASAGGPAGAQAAYALTAGNVDTMVLDGWAAEAPAAGRSCVDVVGGTVVIPAPATPGAAASASGSSSELTTTECSGSISSASKNTASAGQGEVPLSAIESWASWLLEDAGGEQKLPHESVLLDAALHNLGF